MSRLNLAGQLSGSCKIGADRLVAHCNLGQGQVTVVADADLLDVARLGVRAKHNLDGILPSLPHSRLGDSVTNRLIHRPERALHGVTTWPRQP